MCGGKTTLPGVKRLRWGAPGASVPNMGSRVTEGDGIQVGAGETQGGVVGALKGLCQALGQEVVWGKGRCSM